jgi:thiol-disulfide isomerase/thioredoxin
MIRSLIAAGALALVLMASPAAAQVPAGAPTLDMGSPAPGLTIDTWVKGDPVPALQKGQPYVVEFWATWCGPCRQSIPHLTELQKKYGEKVKFIGISSNERKGLEDVKPFVEKMGDKMVYTVAWDKMGQTSAAWMQAAGQQGIPTAFVVDKSGMIAWIGNPIYPEGELDRVLDGVVADSWNIGAEKDRKAKIKVVEAKLQQANANKDAAALLEGIEELMVVDPSRYDQCCITKFQILLFGLHRYEDGYKWAAHLVDDVYPAKPDYLNAIAWAIVDGQGLEKRDLDLALRAATRAENLTDGSNLEVLDTLARVQFEKGSVKDAVATQERALKLAVDPKRKEEMQKHLDTYRAAAG